VEDADIKRIQNLEKSNKQLQKVVDRLTRQLRAVEQQSKRAYHTSQSNTRLITSVQRGLSDVLSKLRINQ